MANSNSSDLALLAIDTSVAINLDASGIAVDIFRALSSAIHIVDIVPAELDGGRGYGAKVLKAIGEWQQLGLVTLAKLSAAGNDTFGSLILGGAATTLDDGEAATIAHAADIGAVAVIDEAKARRLCTQRFPKLVLASSSDLILHPAVLAALGKAAVSDAVFKALTEARMRVAPERHRDVAELIGRKRLALCYSLPSSIRTSTD